MKDSTTEREGMAIHVDGVTKRFKQRVVLDAVSLEVPPCMIYGISGPNGSGKSMLLRVIAGLVRPDKGQVRVFGQAIGTEVEFARDTGILIEHPGFLPNYSGFKNLQLMAMIQNRIGRDEIARSIRLVGLDPGDRRPVRTYSTGMRQRLGIAQAIMEAPRLLLLDEPTSGVDREGIKEIGQLLLNLKAQGVTILMTSHSAEEIRGLCDAAFEIYDGRLMEQPIGTQS
jgi:ABC-2 type transport system ATP-binding protein